MAGGASAISIAELRLQLTGLQAALGGVAALKDRAKEVDKQLKALSAESGAAFIVTMKQARALCEGLGNDTKKVAATLQLAGVSARDIRLIVGQLDKELNSARKNAIGIDKATGDAAAHGEKFVDAIKRGVYSGELMVKTLEAARAKLDELSEAAGIKGLKDSTEESFKLEANFNNLRDSLHLNNDEFAKLKSNVAEISQITGISQEKLTEAGIEVQEKTSQGRELFLNDRGSLGLFLAKNTVGTRAEADTPGAFLAGINASQDLGISTGDLPKAFGIIRGGEEKGALAARNLLVELGGLVAQLADKRGTGNLDAVKEGGALLQSIASAPGFKGKSQLSDVKVVASNLLGKLADPKYQERLKDAGVKVVEKDPSDPKGKRYRLKQISTIVSDIAAAQDSGKIKGTGEGSLETIFKDVEARRAVQALLFRREEGGKTVRPALNLLKDLEKLTPEQGIAYTEEAYSNRIKDRDYRRNLTNAQAQATHYRDFNRRADIINTVGDARAQFEAAHPNATFLAEPVVNLLGSIPKAGPFLQTAVYGLAAGSAVGTQLGTGGSQKNAEQISAIREVAVGRDQESQQFDKTVEQLGQVARSLDELAKRIEAPEIRVTIGDDGSAKVTNASTSSRKAASGGAARKTKPGQG